MTQSLPLSHSYNLARLGNAGDEVHFAASEAERGALAKWAGVLSVEKLEVGVRIKKCAPNRFGLRFELAAEVTQACVVTLEPVPAKIQHSFSRELVFTGPSRQRAEQPPKPAESEIVLGFNPEEAEEGPEEISSLHQDLAVPALEEFVLSLDPYPRRQGVEFAPKTGEAAPPPSPFAVLKGLK
ncbi:MAG TPA: DUF177 domain-containing protein [Rhizomicrobium sp.]|nr:DUF177 domain-containing protein [Rhizomicrobium sp.]